MVSHTVRAHSRISAPSFHLELILPNSIDLIGDGVENPWNAKTMMAAARMFGANCFFTDRKGLSQSAANMDVQVPIQLISRSGIRHYAQLVALENTPDADDIYGFRMRDCTNTAIVAGNEKFGISQELLRQSTLRVQIPMSSRAINTLNVSAASAVALYYLTNDFRARLQRVANPGARRPDLLIIGGTSQIEIGSAIRSATAFGWSSLYLMDRHNVWFECTRAVRSEGRGAARRGRNPICVRPLSEPLSLRRLQYDSVSVITTYRGDVALSKSNLARGRRQLLVIPDESCIEVRNEDWTRFGKHVQFVQIETALGAPPSDYDYHYRLPASIAMAECARQVGTR